jgi:hypothetical protein
MYFICDSLDIFLGLHDTQPGICYIIYCKHSLKLYDGTVALFSS